MKALRALSFSPDEPWTGAAFGEGEPAAPPEGWAPVRVAAASVNHHDVWSLKGVGLRADQLPMVLGTDAAGYDGSGRPVVVHAVIGDPAASPAGDDETLDPRRSLLSERHPGTFAETVWVPPGNVVPLPEGWSMEEAACLPTAWLTAWRMLTTRAGVCAGQTVLVQGATGGVNSAAIVLAKALGATVWATSRTGQGRAFAESLDADGVFTAGERLPGKVDVVVDNVGAATWGHTIRALRPGGTVVTCGATSGDAPSAELTRVFFLQLRVVGSTMGTRAELEELMGFMDAEGIRPVIQETLPFPEGARALRMLAEGKVQGKLVLAWE